MDIISLDFSVFVISVIIASAILAFYYISPKNHEFDFNASDGFAVIDVIRTLKKACPIQFNNKWRLLSQNYGPTRTWSKNISFPGFKNSIKLYGANCAVSCSSMYAFSMISDVSRWGEWESSQSSQNLLRSYKNRDFKKDSLMQADLIAGIQRGTNIQSYIAMYRFLSLPSKCTKWILFWNAKKFEFMFFVIQPAANRSGDVQCVITHLYSSIQYSSAASLVNERIRNIKDFLSLSQLNYRPVHYSTTTIPLSPKFSSFEKELQKEENLPSVFLDETNCDSPDTIFYLVPLFQCHMFKLKKFKGYNLIMKKVNGFQPNKPEEKIVKETSPKKLKLLEPLRRANSDISMMIKTTKLFSSSYESSSSNQLTSIVPNDLNKPSSDTVSEDIEVIEKTEFANSEKEEIIDSSSSKLNLRSVSDPTSQHIEKSQSSSLSELSEIASEEENPKCLDSISELDESTLVVRNHHDKNELLCSSTSEFEVLESSQRFIDTQIASYLTQGNYGASVLQTEMMLASQFDSTMHTGNRVAGGWIHHSTFKGIPVFTKSISGKVMKILSFLCQMELPVFYKDVWRCVKNPRFRFFCDETVKSVDIVDKISETQKLIHIYHETGGLLRKEAIDFCLLQTEREEKANFYSVFQSVEYEKCPFMTSVVRGNLKPSGWIVHNISKRSCKVTYLIQILVNPTDSLYIQELSTLVPQSLHNLKHFVTAKPK